MTTGDRRVRVVLAVLSAAAFLASAVPVFADELVGTSVTNGDMSASSGWSASWLDNVHPTFTEGETLDVHADAAGLDSFATSTSETPLFAGQTVTAWWRAAASGQGQPLEGRALLLDGNDAEGNHLAVTAGGLAGTTWRRIAAVVPFTGSYRIRLYASSGAGGEWDNVSVWGAGGAGPENPPSATAPAVPNGGMDSETGWCASWLDDVHLDWIDDGPGLTYLDVHANAAGNDSFAVSCTHLTLTAGQTVTGWWKANAAGQGQPQDNRALVISTDAGGASWAADVGGLAGTTWRRLAVTVAVTGSYQIRLYASSGTGGRWDNVTVWAPGAAGATNGDTGSGTPLVNDGKFPAYECSRALERDGADWIAVVGAAEVSPSENGTSAIDTFEWWVEWQDPRPPFTDRGGLVGKRWRLTAAQAEAEPPVDVANGYFILLNIERRLAPGHGFDPAQPNPTHPSAAGPHPAYHVETAGDGSQVATGTCRLSLNLDDPELNQSGTSDDPTADVDVDFGDSRNGGAPQNARDCTPSGWGVLSPAAYVEASSCILRWAFIPHTNMSVYSEQLADAAEGTIAASGSEMVVSLFGVPAAFADAAGSGSCQGPGITLSGVPVYPVAACDGVAEDWATFIRLGLTALIVIGGAIAAVNIVQRVWNGPRVADGGPPE